MIFFYDLLLIILSIPVVIFLYITDRRRFNSDFFFELKERFADCGAPVKHENNKKVLWIHCASLGEVRLVESLSGRLKEKYILIITTLTRSAKEYAKKAGFSEYVYFAPLDFSFTLKKFLDNFKPQALAIIETELWPGMLYAAKKNNLATVLINGRLSDHSYPNYLRLRFIFKWVLLKIDLVLARSNEDAVRFAGLGYPKERIKVTGNLKYDNMDIKDGYQRKEFKFKDTDIVWLCASTRDKEEEIIIKAWKDIASQNKALKLIIAPRHIERALEIEKLLKKYALKYSKRSGPLGDNIDCLLLDTFGELQKFYPMSDIVFVGGSLVDTGGQNPVEPASYGKALLFGPYMNNFLNEARILKENKAVLEVSSGDDLAQRIKELIANKDIRVELGKKAKSVVETQKGSIDKTVKELNSLIG